MQLFIDTATNAFITDPLFKSPLQELSFKRGDTATINVAFVSGNTSLSAVSGKEIKFAIKQAGDYDGAPIVYTDVYTTAGTNYVLNPSFNTTALNSLLSGDIPSIAGMLEIEVIQSGIIDSTNTQSVTIQNDVIKNDELAPTSLPTPKEWLFDNLFGIGTPYPITILDDVGTNLSSELYGTFPVFTTDGLTSPAMDGYWTSLTFDYSEDLWRLQLYLDGSEDTDASWYGGGASDTVIVEGLFTNPVTETEVTVGVLDFTNTATISGNRFLKDSAGTSLYVNLGTAENQSWTKLI
jgi:hypothetical protein